jgi:hypothetical protein
MPPEGRGFLQPWLFASLVHGSWHLVDKQFVYNGESISYCSLPVR